MKQIPMIDEEVREITSIETAEEVVKFIDMNEFDQLLTNLQESLGDLIFTDYDGQPLSKNVEALVNAKEDLRDFYIKLEEQ